MVLSVDIISESLFARRWAGRSVALLLYLPGVALETWQLLFDNFEKRYEAPKAPFMLFITTFSSQVGRTLGLW